MFIMDMVKIARKYELKEKQTFDRLSPATEIIVLENTYKITRKGHVSSANVIGNC